MILFGFAVSSLREHELQAAFIGGVGALMLLLGGVIVDTILAIEARKRE